MNSEGRKWIDLFQFHKGTIRTECADLKNGNSLPFQFHKGTIRTIANNRTIIIINQFQFHKGTIRTERS